MTTTFRWEPGRSWVEAEYNAEEADSIDLPVSYTASLFLSFQVDYHSAWQRAVDSFRRLCNLCGPLVNVSIEWKPTDENSRFSIIPSTGDALRLVQEVGGGTAVDADGSFLPRSSCTAGRLTALTWGSPLTSGTSSWEGRIQRRVLPLPSPQKGCSVCRLV